ncbi:hypothetical protein [Paraburkholderia elongata]|uniref:Uncharacterized protein n=1 Tax=Paraburkholderia elongata TaxID=2675747 RepID=A0A972P1Y9_9BURK|nr:hypothetical protein [Paraburkholderia elongata]NPT61655.1 hypothetical protein [Paraburkholderia elongata]
MAEAIKLIQRLLCKEINNSCRAAQYLRDVGELVQTWRADAGQAAIAKHGARRLVNSLMEADALGFVTLLLAEQLESDKILLAKLEKCFNGPLQTEDEVGKRSIEARNFFFEMRLLGQLTYAKLPAVSGEAPDVQTAIVGKPVLIECKRAFSRNNLTSLTRKAREQLDRELEANPEAVGFIAFDFTRILPDDRWYVSYSTRQELNVRLKDVQGYIRKYFEPDIVNALRNKVHERAVGLIEYFQTAGHNKSTGCWGTTWGQEFVPLRDASPTGIVAEFSRLVKEANAVHHASPGADEG